MYKETMLQLRVGKEVTVYLSDYDVWIRCHVTRAAGRRRVGNQPYRIQLLEDGGDAPFELICRDREDIFVGWED